MRQSSPAVKMERPIGRNTKQLLQMLGRALTRENEKWIPYTYLKVPNKQVNELGPEHRRRIVAWLASLNDKFAFYPETFFLSVTILDHFLNAVKARPKYLSCIGVTCFYLAAKTLEEDEVIPDTLEMVRMSECGCSVAEVLRMERCILDKLSWDLRFTTPLDFLHIVHALLINQCPTLLSGHVTLTPSRHLRRLTLVLQYCLIHHDLLAFSPSTLTLAVVSLQLEHELNWPGWLPATIALQAAAQMNTRDLVWCREQVSRCIGYSVGQSIGVLSPPAIAVDQPNKKRRKLDDEDDLYDGIKRLYNEDDTPPVVTMATCSSEVMKRSTISRNKSAVAK